MEAPEKSGALITARLSADQGRDVFVVPANIDVESARGSNALMRDGAIPVSSGWDIMSEYRYQFPGKVRQQRTAVSLTANAEELSRERDAQAIGDKAERMEMLWRMARDSEEAGNVSDAVGCIKELNRMDGAYEPEQVQVQAHLSFSDC